jgi:hypothetical protein
LRLDQFQGSHKNPRKRVFCILNLCFINFKIRGLQIKTRSV